jgi:hypothetical protein
MNTYWEVMSVHLSILSFHLKRSQVNLILTCMGQMQSDRAGCAPRFLLTALLAYSSTKMESIHFSNTLVDFHQTMQHYIPEDRPFRDN